MQVINTCAHMQHHMRLQQPQTVALVPTMGNLHAGHARLIQQAQTIAQHVIVSIFINPNQFNQASDFSSYPRTLDADVSLLETLQVDAVFVPDEAQIYPPDSTEVEQLRAPYLGDEFCGRFRPGHFDGVCTVVARLLSIIPAHYALFGEKDYQQLLIIQRLAADLKLATKIVPVATVRDDDGVALSSRNQHLAPAEREQARQIYLALQRAQRNYALEKIEEIQQEAIDLLTNQSLTVDYFSIRDAADLRTPTAASTRIVIMTAVTIGTTRLLDNVLFQIV